MSYKKIEIDKKNYVLRGNFTLPSEPQKVIKKAEVEETPANFSAQLNALLATEGQNTLIEEDTFKKEFKARQDLEKKRKAKK